jgi:hypothetical protein
MEDSAEEISLTIGSSEQLHSVQVIGLVFLLSMAAVSIVAAILISLQ